MWYYTIAFGLCVALLVFTTKRQRTAPLPPRPRGWPIVGNLFDLPQAGDPIPWLSHRDIYGPISCVQLLGKTIVLLNDLRTATDLLDKRSSNYSGRPIFPFAGTLVGWDQQLIMSQYGQHFKTMRRLLKAHIGTSTAIKNFEPLQEAETRWLLSRILDKPENIMADIRLAAGSIFLQISHGYKIAFDEPDPLVNLVETAADEFYHATMPGTWLIDIFSSLQHIPSWMPGSGFKKVASIYRSHNFEQTERPYTFVKRQMKEGIALTSFTSAALSDGVNPETEHAIKFAATGIYGGGSDPIVATLKTFLLLMIIHPECQRQAQEELDLVVGSKRLPIFSDRARLPYIDAIIKEVLRWHTVGRIGIPHRLIEDDYYNGYLIPKDSIVIPHMWHITHDSAMYKDPTVFRPTRFMASEGSEPELDPNKYLYGFGRRACPGQIVANAHLFITCAMFLSVFNIHKASDGNGVEIEPSCEFTGGTVSHPVHFPFIITPRSEEARSLIASMREGLELRYSNADDL